MRENGTFRLFRGQTIRTRADVQRTAIEHDASPLTEMIGAVLGLAWWALRWTGWALVMTAWFLAYVPAAGLLAAGTVALAVLVGPLTAVILLGVPAGAAAAAWRYWRPDTWSRWITSRISRFIRRIRYRWVWDDLMAASGLSARDASHRITVPRLLWVHLGEHFDRLTVQLCSGITREKLAGKFEELRAELRGLEVRVLAHPHCRGWAELRVVVSDPLAVDPADAKGPKVDLGRLLVGRREDGRPWHLSVRSRHLLFAGATNAGKSALVAALMRALAPAIHAGWVRVIGIDPKGGMEFGMYSELFTMLACENEAELVAALEAAATRCSERTRSLRGKVRALWPTVDAPFYLVLIDEIASLTSYIVDRNLKERARVALGTLLSKGRAPGYCVVGCVQDPRKEVLELRNLFTTRIALRLDSASEVAMVLGEQAHDRGARCEEIPEETPGIGYQVEDGRAAVTRVRSDNVSDAELGWLAAMYPAPHHEPVPELVTPPKQERKKAAS